MGETGGGWQMGVGRGKNMGETGRGGQMVGENVTGGILEGRAKRALNRPLPLLEGVGATGVIRGQMLPKLTLTFIFSLTCFDLTAFAKLK